MKTYVARQPILDKKKQIFGYELLYRNSDGTQRTEGPLDGDKATYLVISDVLTSFGVRNITGNSLAFINFTKTVLTSTIPSFLDPKDIVVEILEDTEIDESFLHCVEQWKQNGYTIALDDYVGDARFDALMPLVDIVKVDFRLADAACTREIATTLLAQGKRLLAEKVETEEDYRSACDAGYTLFQGYYFQRPILMSADLPEIQNSTSLRVFAELSKPDIDFENLANIIRSDVSLSYKLLKYIGTAQFYRGNQISSVHTALVRMGVQNVRHWISLIFIRDATAKDNAEQVRAALVRGMFAERTAISIGRRQQSNDAFMTGMFSMLGTMLNGNLSELLDSVCLSQEVKDALLQQQGILHEILEFVTQYQDGDWDGVMRFSDKFGLDSAVGTKDYFTSAQYADQLFGT